MDFYTIKTRSKKKGMIEVYPSFKVTRSNDLMVRGRSFFAIWDEERRLWSTDEYDVQHLVDKDLYKYRDDLQKKMPDDIITVRSLNDFSTGMWTEFKRYLTQVSDNSRQLDSNLTFANTKVRKKDYTSKTLPYELKKGDISAYDELIGTLYSEEERRKIEWAIGSIVNGDSKFIQKFVVLYGEPGAGKGTIIKIIQKLFEGYYAVFEAAALTSRGNQFATESFKSNPLVAIQNDGDLSKIEDNTKLNSIVSHEEITMNEKYKSTYVSSINAFLIMASNKPVKITDARSGVIRRLIDVHPTGTLLKPKHYQALMAQIDFELGAIAYHCLKVYEKLGKNYYETYRPVDMMYKTDVFFNFIEDNYFTFKNEEGITLKHAYNIYKDYCDDTAIPFKLPMYKFREELKVYFGTFHETTRVDGKQVRSYFTDFKHEKFKHTEPEPEEHQVSLVMDHSISILDEVMAEKPAQYAKETGGPKDYWKNVTTKLKDLKTTELHWVRPDKNHIVIDFDLKDSTGEKSLELNLEAASKWPATYSELSQGGNGIHLHYYYDGDVKKLSTVYDNDIEVKVFTGKSSLRRRLSKCNNHPIATINSGLPLKGEKMVNFEAVKNEKALRSIIIKCLNKEIHPQGTKPNVDFIHKVLEDAFNNGLRYDVSDMRPAVLAFANNSSNQAAICIKIVADMKWQSEEPSESELYTSDDIYFFDVEVFPNFFGIVIKKEDGPKQRFINPSPKDVEILLKKKLVGFNCRRYDNHMMYARYLGYDNERLYQQSKRIIDKSKNAYFAEAYGLSYTDVYDFASEKQSLKKWELELGLKHKELDIPWDEPVPEDRWEEVMDYCEIDVDATEAVFKARKDDWVARQIISELSGLTPNDTTQRHAAKIIFGNDRNPQKKFVYTDLSEEFPGYEFDHGKSTYRGEKVSEGGQVYSEPGMYWKVGLFDIESQHPTSGEILNIFGPYTVNYVMLKNGRLEIKHHNMDEGIRMLSEILSRSREVSIEEALEIINAIILKYDVDEKKLSYALKIIINIVYGMTSAKFANPFKDPRNIDNIMAKRGALFMIDLKHAVQDQGYQVAHIKTDSIKIPNVDDHIAKFIIDFGKKYGYNFEYEAIYDRMCLVNDAVYIAKYAMKDGEPCSDWTATGAQFAHPYVFKHLFTKEPIEFRDMCETKTVTTTLYLDMNEKLGEDEHHYHFVGKAGSFCPIVEGAGGGLLLRKKDDKYYAATGTKGYRWMEAEMVSELGKQDDIDLGYFRHLCDDARANISQYGDFEEFLYSEMPACPKKFTNEARNCIYAVPEEPPQTFCKNCKNTFDELPF